MQLGQKLQESTEVAAHTASWPYEPSLSATLGETSAPPLGIDRTLESRTRELAEANRRQELLILALSHELRNPLQALSMGLELLGSPRTDTYRGAQLLATMRRQLGHLASIANDLLDLTRLTRGLARIERKRIDLRQVVLETTEEYAPIIRARGRRFVVDVGDAPTPIRGDARRLGQAVASLLSNGLKYTKRGGQIRITLERIPSPDGGSEAVLRVQDDGVGIPTEMLQAIFQPFVQLDMKPDRVGGGLGLGLPIVQGIVRAHGGEVDAASRGHGCGTEFVVRKLSILRERSATGQVRPHRPSASVQRIVVVEDNDDSRDGLIALLGTWGHQAFGASDGEKGLALILHERPDVALIDLGLPLVDGYEVARRVRAMPKQRRVRLIAVTGYGGSKERELARQAGFDAHLVKPIDTERLANMLVLRRTRSTPAYLG
jgi:signal transduction histidine kinase/ActR/RegA family two-component response regulator